MHAHTTMHICYIGCFAKLWIKFYCSIAKNKKFLNSSGENFLIVFLRLIVFVAFTNITKNYSRLNKILNVLIKNIIHNKKITQIVVIHS